LSEVIARLVRHLPWRPLVAVTAVVVAVLVALGWTGNWNLILAYIFQVPYGRSDPLYGNDFSFYLFALPLYIALKDWMLVALALSAILAALVYWAFGKIVFDTRRRFVSADRKSRPRGELSEQSRGSPCRRRNAERLGCKADTLGRGERLYSHGGNVGAPRLGIPQICAALMWRCQ
jgi:hypothetical protein